jgi:RecA/RadA recombinase
VSTQPVPDPTRVAYGHISTRKLTTPLQIEWLLLCCANDLQFFLDTQILIKPEHFSFVEKSYRMAYESMVLASATCQGITFQTLRAACEEILGRDSFVTFSTEEFNLLVRPDAEGLLYHITHPAIDVEFNAPNLALGRNILQKFAEERLVHAPLLEFLNPSRYPGSHVPDNLGGFLDLLETQRSQLTTVKQIPLVDVAPAVGSHLEPAQILVRSGSELIDQPLGGQVRGDVNGIIGPTGGGKTTLGLFLAVQAAKQCAIDAAAGGPADECSIYVTIEEAAIRLRPRIWSACCDIDRARLTAMNGDWSYLSQRGGPYQDYELQDQGNQTDILSETERYEMWRPTLANNFKLLDLSGSFAYPDAGEGYIAEIVSYVSRLSVPIRSLFIDYAGLLAERYCAAKGLDVDEYQRLLKNFGNLCKSKIAERFQCTVWGLHQLKSDLGNASAARLMSHVDAEGSKAFATNMANCACLSPVDKNTGVRMLNWSKTRGHDTVNLQPMMLRIDSRFAKINNVSNLYVRPPSGGRIMTVAEYAAAHRLSDNGAIAQAGPAGQVHTSNQLDPMQTASRYDGV